MAIFVFVAVIDETSLLFIGVSSDILKTLMFKSLLVIEWSSRILFECDIITNTIVKSQN